VLAELKKGSLGHLHFSLPDRPFSGMRKRPSVLVCGDNLRPSVLEDSLLLENCKLDELPCGLLRDDPLLALRSFMEPSLMEPSLMDSSLSDPPSTELSRIMKLPLPAVEDDFISARVRSLRLPVAAAAAGICFVFLGLLVGRNYGDADGEN